MPDQTAYAQASDQITKHPVQRIENEILLSGSLSLVNFFQLFFDRLHQLFAVDCAVLLLYDADLENIVDSYVSSVSSDHKLQSEGQTAKIALSSISETIAKLDYPILRSSEEWMDQYKANQTVINGEVAYHYHCYIPLEAQNRVIGTLELHNYDTELSHESLAYCTNLSDFFADCILRSTLPQSTDKLREYTENAMEFAEHPFELAEQVLDLAELAEQVLDLAELADQIEVQHNYPNIIGKAPAMQNVFNLLSRVADTETTVLILGETGTGKELIAKAIHENSSRVDEPMIKVNCAAIPASLIESELFGHEKGSFTGATELRIGKFELANNSTLFLDEIAELSLELQVKLLRALQEKEIERVGGKTTIKTDVRIVSATNRNLIAEVEAGRFRRDLFYRLNVFPISLPALRERKEDLPLLAAHFLSGFTKKAKRTVTGFSKKALQDMSKYDWPGNIRELEHVIERHVLLASGPVIKSIDLPELSHRLMAKNNQVDHIKTIFENERDHIFNVLKLCNGKVSGHDGAAKLLGVPATTLNSKIKRLSLSKKHTY